MTPATRIAMQPRIGSKLKEKHANAWLPALQQRLYGGERITLLSRTTLMRPVAEGIAITTARVMAFNGMGLQSGKMAFEAIATDISAVRLESRSWGGKNCLVITMRDGREVNFGDIPAEDAQLVIGTVKRLAAVGMSPHLDREASQQAHALAEREAAWNRIQVVANKPSGKVWKVLRDHAAPDEVPWFVVGGEMGAGALAAFADRCMIVKVGAMASTMAGSFGGGRITTFPYGEITGIEYNAGMVGGVLEILTPSYQGSANKDYWRGAFKSTNSDSNNPWTLSNTLPIVRPMYQQALPLLNEMRAKIAEAKRPTVVVNAPPPSAGGGGLAEEIGKLAALRDQGVLSDQEFQAAKQAAIARATR